MDPKQPLPAHSIRIHCNTCTHQWQVTKDEAETDVKTPCCPECEGDDVLFLGSRGRTLEIPSSLISPETEIVNPPPPATMEFPPGLHVILEVVKGANINHVFELTKPLTTVGRLAGGIDLKDRQASRKHFAIEVRSETAVSIKDLVSTNGTFVNSKRVCLARLHDGDLIRAGNTILRIKIGHKE